MFEFLRKKRKPDLPAAPPKPRDALLDLYLFWALGGDPKGQSIKTLDELMPLVEKWGEEHQRVHGAALAQRTGHARWPDRMWSTADERLQAFEQWTENGKKDPQENMGWSRDDFVQYFKKWPSDGSVFLRPENAELVRFPSRSKGCSDKPMLHALANHPEWASRPNDPRWATIIDTLLAGGISIDGLTNQYDAGMTALAYAILKRPVASSEPFVRLLAARGASLDIGWFEHENEELGTTPLQSLAQSPLKYPGEVHRQLLELLLDLGANPNITTPNGRTPLHMAVEKDFVSLFEPLVKHGADAYRPNDKGNTPLDLAQQKVSSHAKGLERAARGGSPRDVRAFENLLQGTHPAHQEYVTALKTLQTAVIDHQRQELLEAYATVQTDEPVMKSPSRRRL